MQHKQTHADALSIFISCMCLHFFSARFVCLLLDQCPLPGQEVELALGPFTITPQREVICDMTLPLSTENKAIMVERPKLRTDMAGFLNAFTLEVRHRPA